MKSSRGMRTVLQFQKAKIQEKKIINSTKTEEYSRNDNSVTGLIWNPKGGQSAHTENYKSEATNNLSKLTLLKLAWK